MYAVGCHCWFLPLSVSVFLVWRIPPEKNVKKTKLATSECQRDEGASSGEKTGSVSKDLSLVWHLRSSACRLLYATLFDFFWWTQLTRDHGTLGTLLVSFFQLNWVGGFYFPIFFKPFDLLLGKEHGEKRIKRKTRNRKEKINDGTKW